MPVPMGIGNLGFNNLVFKQKFRYTFEIFNICGGQQVKQHFVKLAARPKISIEPTEVNFLNSKTWIPGKASWETITVTYFDVANTLDLKPLYNWLASIYNFSTDGGFEDVIRPTRPRPPSSDPDPDDATRRRNRASRRNFIEGSGNPTQASKKSDWSATAVLIMLDGTGNSLEQWTLKDCWPESVDFGSVDYSESEISTIEMTIRYSDVSYQAWCPAFIPQSCCTSC